ncbi:uncharacterized protein LOC117370301 [Periophthalmus magnuspinnatus]|uniref:uncharacterized protein LOC117370301 n=1 Tax=Periophthalmus magnuspinnatus TaxID=409849 RepID=UPI00145B0C91|nr:uncharacterized protein LOC117370301 [Periophthalmus magnuspinnatus]
MAEPCHLEDTIYEGEKEFQKILAEIGGRERIHLVSDVGKSKEDDDAGILQEFLRDVFSQTSFPNGQPHSAHTNTHCDTENENLASCKTRQATNLPLTVRPKAVTNPSEIGRETRNGSQKSVWRRDIYSTKRTIDSPVIIFIFRNTFLKCHSNLVCLKEILKDVKARTKRAQNAQPALIGLIRTSLESAETKQCAVVLENMMRSVFHRHVPDSMWIGSFVPKKEEEILEIKKNFCRVIYSSRTADNTGHRGNSLFWPFQCLLGPIRRAPRDRAKSNSTDNWQSGNPKDLEENIPLKTYNQSVGPHTVDEELAVKDR